MKVLLSFLALFLFGCHQKATQSMPQEAPPAQAQVQTPQQPVTPQQTSSKENTNTAPQEKPPTESKREIKGIDVSKYQGNVDFSKIKAAGFTYVFAKATQGNTYQDPDYLENYKNARAQGLLISAYHYFMTDDAPQTQFDNISEHVTLVSGDLPPVVDIEALAKGTLDDWKDNLQQFLDRLEDHYGAKPIIYSGKNFANSNLSQFGTYPLWLAEYGVDAPKIPTGWSDWTFWQWTQSGTVNGIDGDVDEDRFNGDMAQLKTLLIP